MRRHVRRADRLGGRGQSLIEYALIFSLIVLISLTALSRVSSAAGGAFSSLVNGLSTPVQAARTATISTAPTMLLTGATAIGGTLRVGSNGLWTGSPTAFHYQWQRCQATCANIPGATASAYQVDGPDIGYSVSLLVSATNAVGVSAPVAASQSASIADQGNWLLREGSADEGAADSTGGQVPGSYYRNIYEQPSAAKDSMGFVHVRGLARASAAFALGSSAIIGYLPAGDRPAMQLIFYTLMSDPPSWVHHSIRTAIYPDGRILAEACINNCPVGGVVGTWAALNNIVFPGADAKMTALDLAPGWTNFNSGWQTAAWSLDASDVIHLSGLIKATTTFSKTTAVPIANLPFDYSNVGKQITEAGTCQEASYAYHVCRVDIRADGSIILVDGQTSGANLQGTIGTWVSLSGINFSIDPVVLDWQPLPLSSGWAPWLPNIFFTPEYVKDANGIVHLRGVATSVAPLNSLVATLPPDDRPGAYEIGAGAMASNMNTPFDNLPRVDSTGPLGANPWALIFNYALPAFAQVAGTWLGIDNVSYPAATNALTWTPLTSGWSAYSPVTGVTTNAADEAAVPGAVSLSGGSYVSLGNASNLQVSSGTISAWEKSTDNSASYHGLLLKHLAYGIFILAGEAIAYDWNTGTRLYSGVNVADGAWHQVAVVFGSGSQCIFVDGLSRACGPMTVASQNEPLVLGAGMDLGNFQSFTGTIAQPQLFSRQLTADQLADLYALR